MISAARETVREPIWRGNLLADPETKDPSRARLIPNESGEVEIWEMPDERYHYVIGADCMWSKKAEGSDWDVLYVERLEPDETGRGPLCAKIRGKWSLTHWGWLIGAMGWQYNCCPVAPEITGQESAEGQGVLGVLLGEVGEYRYPNVWIRSKRNSLRGGRVEDYGWDTSSVTKPLLLGLSQTGSLERTLDWCDKGAVDEQAMIIHRKNGSVGAPEGKHDDRWMARLITAEVAKRQRYITDLYCPNPIIENPYRTPERRFKEMEEELRLELYDDDDSEFVVV